MIVPSVRPNSFLAQALNRIGQCKLADRVVWIQHITGPILLLAKVSQESSRSNGVFFPVGDIGVEVVARGHENEVRRDAFGFRGRLLTHPL